MNELPRTPVWSLTLAAGKEKRAGYRRVKYRCIHLSVAFRMMGNDVFVEDGCGEDMI